MNYVLSVVVLLLAGCLMLVSYVERVYAEMGKFLSREFEENIEAFEQRIEPKLAPAASALRSRCQCWLN